MYSLVKSLVIVAAVAVAIWLVGIVAGFRISLFWTLLLSIGLTLVLNLGALSRRRDRLVRW